MASLSAYTSLLNHPAAELISETITLNYITTATTLTGSISVLNHLRRLRNQEFKDRTDRKIHAVEAGNTLVLESETSLEFVEGGGAFLPGIDSAFLSDQKVVFPLVHVVEFRNGLIEQIRLYWDQSTLLKQVGTIGRSGLNWPIKLGPEQIKLLDKAVKSLPEASKENGTSAPTKAATGPASTTSSKSNGTTRVYKDPHASLDLFSPHKKEDDRPIAPRKMTGTHRPPTRDLVDIVGTVEDERPIPSTPVQKIRSDSMSTTASRPKHLTHESQFSFGDGEDVVETPIHKRSKKHDPQFEFGDGEDAPAPVPTTIRKNEKHAPSFDLGGGESAEPESPIRSVIGRKNKPATNPDFLFDADDTENKPINDPLDRPLPKRNPKHNSTWDFSQFATPEKIPIRHRPADTLHFRLSDHDEDDDKTPVKVTRKPLHRADAETHFTLADQSDDENTPRTSNGNGTKKSSGLKDTTNRPISSRPFSSNFEFVDASPAPNGPAKKLSNDRREAVKMIMETHYDLYSENSPTPDRSAPAPAAVKGGKLPLRNKTTERSWGFGNDDGEQEEEVQSKRVTRGATAAKKLEGNKDFWDF